MRFAAFVAVLVVSAVLVSGCSKKKEDDDHLYVCKSSTSTVTIDLEKYPEHHNATFNPATKCPGYKGTGSASNSTSLAPNVPPVLKLKIVDAGGNATNVTMLNGNLTFDATGSKDPDGQVTGIAVTVQDSNQTRTGALFDPVKKTFKTATFKFDRAGIVNVTVAMVDDRAGFTVNKTHVYVDQTVTTGQKTLTGTSPAVGTPTDCEGPAKNTLIDPAFSTDGAFPVVAGATWIEAKATPNGKLAICAPTGSGEDGKPGSAISDAGAEVRTAKGAAIPTPAGIKTYYVEIYSTSANQAVGAVVTVHYEPDTGA
jgi:hypothetical protein